MGVEQGQIGKTEGMAEVNKIRIRARIHYPLPVHIALFLSAPV